MAGDFVLRVESEGEKVDVGLPKELTKEKRREIKKLVVAHCANYDRENACLPLDYGRCYMIDKCWTGAYCKYFKEAVLPLNPVLEESLVRECEIPARICNVCGKPFREAGKRAYCSKTCASDANRKKSRARMAKTRKK